ncbi:Flp pilus assembly protein protease CpaA [Paenibacillus turicensis]|uniref:Flp pilus assembly protein protease CpaA n=1 Tax=Paenibacillus turicensis TaxID=160487 RepID=A0ABS4FW02_9BACL|nr:Flp pilus assembly protein protease CpaA [Paenibacillus turicensis]
MTQNTRGAQIGFPFLSRCKYDSNSCVSSLYMVSYTDIRYRTISNKITHPLILICLVWRLLNPVYVLGIFPALILFILFLIKPDGIGAGDIKLLAVIGLVFGLQRVVSIAIIMCTTLLVYSVLRRYFVKEVYAFHLLRL